MLWLTLARWRSCLWHLTLAGERLGVRWLLGDKSGSGWRQDESGLTVSNEATDGFCPLASSKSICTSGIPGWPGMREAASFSLSGQRCRCFLSVWLDPIFVLIYWGMDVWDKGFFFFFKEWNYLLSHSLYIQSASLKEWFLGKMQTSAVPSHCAGHNKVNYCL